MVVNVGSVREINLNVMEKASHVLLPYLYICMYNTCKSLLFFEQKNDHDTEPPQLVVGDIQKYATPPAL